MPIQVSGTLKTGASLYRAAERVNKTHLAVIRKNVVGKKVWVATDEWTDSQGHAIINVLLGCEGFIYVIAAVQLDCKGPSLGVEHSELGTAVVDALNDIGVPLKNVLAFVSGLHIFFAFGIPFHISS